MENLVDIFAPKFLFLPSDKIRDSFIKTKEIIEISLELTSLVLFEVLFETLVQKLSQSIHCQSAGVLISFFSAVYVKHCKIYYFLA